MAKKLQYVGIAAVLIFLTMVATAFAAVDLSVSSYKITPSGLNAGEDVMLQVTVENVGDTTTDGASLYVGVKKDLVNEVWNASMVNFTVGKGEERAFSFLWIPADSGVHTVEFEVSDPADGNATNDKEMIALYVYDAEGVVDVEITDYNIPTDIKTSRATDMEITIKNTGTAPTGSTVLNFRAIKEDFVKHSWSKAGIHVGSGDERIETITWVPAEAGNYILEVWLDDTTDSDTSNNDVMVARTVLNVYTSDLQVENLYATSTVYVDKYGYTDQPIYINGFVTKDEAGTNDWVAISIEEVFYDYVSADKDNHGYFSSEIGGGFYFDELGNYIVQVDVHRENGENAHAWTSFDVVRGSGGGGYTPGPSGDDDDDEPEEEEDEYVVDVEITPNSRIIEAGEENYYTVEITNYGNMRDTYYLDFSAPYDAEDWLDLSKSKVSLNAGSSTTVRLYVELPTDAEGGTYPIRVTAESDEASDTDRTDLEVGRRINRLDVEVETPEIAPLEVPSDYTGNILVSAQVRYTDLYGSSGKYVDIDLYVDGVKMEDERMYFTDGQRRVVDFYISARDHPISRTAGDYQVYIKASVDTESDMSRSATLTVEQAGGLTLSMSPSRINSTSDGSFTTNLVVNNIDSKENTYTIYANGLDIALDPASVTVGAKSSKVIALDGTLLNAPIGNYTADIHVKGDNDNEFVTIKFYIAEELLEQTDSAAGGGLSAYLLAGSGGLMAAIIGIVIITGLVGYYFYQKKLEEQTKGQQPGGAIGLAGTLTSGTGPGTGAAPGMAAAPAAPKKLFDLGRIKTINATPMERQWTHKDADRVMGDLGGVQAGFVRDAVEANQIKGELNAVNGGAATGETTEPSATGNGYVDDVVKSV